MPSRSATGEVATLAAALFAIAKVIVGILVWKTLALLKRGTLLTPACPSSKLAGT